MFVPPMPPRRDPLEQLSAELRRHVLMQLDELVSYRPVIGVLGKTGAGKSSLCNALFGRDVCAVSHTGACTRQVQTLDLQMGRHGMQLLDLPGVGESLQRDQEYDALYRRWLPKVDLLLWVIKADDRALSVDEDFYRRLVQPHLRAGLPLLVVLNQADKVEPVRQWDEQARQPGAQQAQHIEEKRQQVASLFGLPLAQVLATSASERYGLGVLTEQMIRNLPARKRISVLREVQEPYRTPEARRQTNNGIADFLCEAIGMLPLPPQIKVGAQLLVRGIDWLIGRL